jgi:hypothetical protein
MDNKLLYAMAPAGSVAVHPELGSYSLLKRVLIEPTEWLPIPAREIELNRLADKCSHWHTEPRLAKVDANDFYFPLNLSPDCGFTKEQWHARRALRIEHGLILEPAPEVNETPDSQWAPEVGEKCEATWNREYWVTITPKFFGEKYVVYYSHESNEEHVSSLFSGFRPIKTERERFVASLVETLIELDSDNWTHDANFIYDWLVGRGVDLSPLMKEQQP